MEQRLAARADANALESADAEVIEEGQKIESGVLVPNGRGQNAGTVMAAQVGKND